MKMCTIKGATRSGRVPTPLSESITTCECPSLRPALDVYLNQTLAAIRFNINESSKFSPFFLLYNRDVVLPVDNLLRPRRKYLGEDRHEIALEQQHEAFVAVHRRMKKARRRQAKYADRNSKPVEIKVGDAVYHKNHQRKNKLESKWSPYFRVMKQTSPVTFVIRNQLDGTTMKTHAEHLRLAKLEEWDLPKTRDGRPMLYPLRRRAVTAVVKRREMTAERPPRTSAERGTFTLCWADIELPFRYCVGKRFKFYSSEYRDIVYWSKGTQPCSTRCPHLVERHPNGSIC